MLIYKATSKTTGKIYIGQTSQTLQQRISQHKCHSDNKNYHFYNAIKKYGFDDFIFEIVEDDIQNADELNKREKYWIKYYDSYENGYNSTRGGDGSVRRDDELILKLFMDGKTTKEITEITGYNRSTIYRSFQLSGVSGQNNERNYERTRSRCSEPVEQFTTDGEFVKIWASASEAGRFFGGQTAISSVCRQENHALSAYGFLFKYANDKRDISEWVSRYKNKKCGGKKRKKILQLDDNKTIINSYESGADAARALGLKDKSCICCAARKKGKSHGYYWEYLE